MIDKKKMGRGIFLMTKTKSMVLGSLFVALMAVGANVSSFLTIGGVPITLQLMFAIIAGGLLGSRLGALSMLVYMLVGLAGAPVFAQFKGGIASVLSPTFGFIVSFIFVTYVVGKIFENGKGMLTYVMAGVSSILVNYLIGTNLMYLAFKMWADAPSDFSFAMAWGWMAAYLPLDVTVVVVSLVLVQKLQKATKYQPAKKITTV